MKSIVASAVLRRGMGLFLGTCLVLVMTGSAFAGNAYTDLKGRFAFDLPDGWKFDSTPAEGACGGDNECSQYSFTRSMPLNYYCADTMGADAIVFCMAP